MIKAIETEYNGYRFRSRLEARWAVFFDAVGLKWEYEKEGFDLEGTWYLPDFWLPDWHLWVEIKGATPTHDEKKKCQFLAKLSKYNVLLLAGEIKKPNPLDSGSGYEGTLFIGNLGRAHEFGFDYGYFFLQQSWLYGFLEEKYAEFPNIFSEPLPGYDGSLENIAQLYELDCIYYQHSYGKPHPYHSYGPTEQASFYANPTHEPPKLQLSSYPSENTGFGKVGEALRAAQQARFEHGETPNPNKDKPQ